jgi:hypothetical protein
MTRDAFALTEAQWQAQVVGIAHHTGWLVCHTRPSEGRRRGERAWQTTTSVKGWPDLVLARPGAGVIFAELKSDRGRLSAEQRDVLATLDGSAGDGVHVCVWRPRDFDQVEGALIHGHVPPGLWRDIASQTARKESA